MTATEHGISVTREEGPDAQRAAAGIWAAATARRDGDDDVATIEEALPVIERALALPGASLQIARSGDSPAGFVLAVSDGSVLEIHYLAVDPASWGKGVAVALLHSVADVAVATGIRRLELWVYDDNDRAVAVYRKAGWNAGEQVRTHATSLRTERLFTLDPERRAAAVRVSGGSPEATSGRGAPGDRAG